MNSKSKKHLRLVTYNGDHSTAYLELADHPHEPTCGVVKKTVRVQDIIPDYDGPGMAIDFDEKGRAIGIEILYPHDEFFDEECQ
jgi:uncharacterized protein YuzE